jgi:thiosulfate/3-mercaptopyruvate sulfurtransferase
VAPAVGFEPTTKRLTAARSTTELRRSEWGRRGDRRAGPEGPRAGRRIAEDPATGSRAYANVVARRIAILFPVESPLVAPETLARWIADERPDLRVVDVRWHLGKPPGAGRAAYGTGHIPGAIHLDIDDELTARSGPGRHPLPDPHDFAAAIGAAGIGDDDTVVAYDDVGGWVAARLWWMLEDLGFGEGGRGRILVLDGGLPAWTAAGGPTSTDVPRPERAEVHLAGSWRRVVDRASLKRRLGRVLLLDARGGPRYRGEIEPIDPLPGHIPTALNAPTDDNLGGDGRFRPPNELADTYRTARRRAAAAGLEVGAGDDAAVVVSCGSGISACHDALAMRVAGLPDPLLYPGSYSDWSRSGEAIAIGPEPGRPPA